MSLQQVDFYIMPQPNFLACQLFACQLAEKMIAEEHNLIIHCESITTAKLMEQQLWSFRDTSFIPHYIEETNPNFILIDTYRKTKNHILLNMSLTQDPQALNSQELQQIVQIVPNVPQLLQWARSHYKYYKNLNCAVNSHKINQQ